MFLDICEHLGSQVLSSNSGKLKSGIDFNVDKKELQWQNDLAQVLHGFYVANSVDYYRHP
ncbi:MAG: hypothetical protein GXX96_26660 [Planctomycetaceae bacterium]|nr:hypothetical protein [Planctomycetaceae bacterium]